MRYAGWPYSSAIMVPGPFNPPPTVRCSEESRRSNGHPYDVHLLAFAVALAGIAGFLGFLIAGSLIPSAATPLRAVALAWFAIFGVWHVRVSSRIR